MISSFGGKTRALLTTGGAAGQRIEESLASMGFPYEVVNVKAESRINLTISDKHGLTIKLNEVGSELTETEVDSVAELLIHGV